MENKGKKDIDKFAKIVYFDEQAAVDYLELTNNGNISKIINNISDKTRGYEVEGNIGKNILGVLGIRLSGSVGDKRSSIVETQIVSSILTEFMEVADGNINLVKIKNSNIIMTADSSTYIRTITPIFNMIKDIEKVNLGEVEGLESFRGFDIKKIEETIDSLSGYYEMLCIEDGKYKIIRFNISGLRNNYKLKDIAKMDLRLYGVKVGTTDNLNINFEYLFQNGVTVAGSNDNNREEADFSVESNQKLDEMKPGEKDDNQIEKYDIIDIILAGV